MGADLAPKRVVLGEAQKMGSVGLRVCKSNTVVWLLDVPPCHENGAARDAFVMASAMAVLAGMVGCRLAFQREYDKVAH